MKKKGGQPGVGGIIGSEAFFALSFKKNLNLSWGRGKKKKFNGEEGSWCFEVFAIVSNSFDIICA